MTSEIPGDAPSANAAIQVTINGQPRVFDGRAGWVKGPNPSGEEVVGFQTDADSTTHWSLFLSLGDHQLGTYTCGADDFLGGLSIGPDGQWNDDSPFYGGPIGSSASGSCTITLESYSPKKGEHVTGTFSGELELSHGKANITHLSLTDGKFDLVNIGDAE